MIQCIKSLAQIAQKYDAIVFDQMGFSMMAAVQVQARLTVGLTLPRPSILYQRFQIQANAPRQMLKGFNMGFSNGLFNQIMTSGEALWHDIDQGKIALSKFFAIARA